MKILETKTVEKTVNLEEMKTLEITTAKETTLEIITINSQIKNKEKTIKCLLYFSISRKLSPYSKSFFIPKLSTIVAPIQAYVSLSPK